jgi:hypothetical protein
MSSPFPRSDPSLVATLERTMGPNVNEHSRTAVLSDPLNVSQFACFFDDTTFGFFTRPVVVPGANGTVSIVGNFTNTIGDPSPFVVPLDDEFMGHFTTLVHKADSNLYNLAVHPRDPDTLDGRVRNGRAAAGTLERLQFPMPNASAAGDYPVIAALPLFLPVGPVQTFPHSLPLADAGSFADTYPLFQVWWDGIIYAKTMNEGRSVSSGGPLFNTADLLPAEGDNDPFGTLHVFGVVATHLQQLSPTHASFALSHDRLLAWSDSVLIDLGSALPPEPVVAAGTIFTPEHFRAAAMEPLAYMSKTFSAASRTVVRTRLLLMQAPLPGDPAQDQAILPDLFQEFFSYLAVPSSATAAEDFREAVKSHLNVANASDISLDCDVTLEPENITLAFSDWVRIFAWLYEKLINTSPTVGRSTLSLLHLLTPN